MERFDDVHVKRSSLTKWSGRFSVFGQQFSQHDQTHLLSCFLSKQSFRCFLQWNRRCSPVDALSLACVSQSRPIDLIHASLALSSNKRHSRVVWSLLEEPFSLRSDNLRFPSLWTPPRLWRSGHAVIAASVNENGTVSIYVAVIATYPQCTFLRQDSTHWSRPSYIRSFRRFPFQSRDSHFILVGNGWKCSHQIPITKS
jgi:hypothetical protein